MRTAARIAQVAMWIMIAAIILRFFLKDTWVTTTWIVAAIVCGVCMLIVAMSKNSGSRRHRH